ncbi:MAG: hypothetical protein JWO06_1105, partial [Bacteroidota bacterium]|nr:hypothetical protein [Bacteroidota bacterium]
TTIGFDSLHISATHVDAGCGTSTGSASVQVLSGTGPYRYLWNTGDSINSITNVAGGAYRVTITDALGCSSVNIITISGLGATSVAITGPTNTICAPDTATLCATSGFTSYHWNNGDTTICINTTAAGNYYVTVTDNSGCTAESNHIPVNFYPVPPVSITVNGDTMRVYNGNTFQWYLNGVAIPNATSNVYIATVPGNYQVRITDSNNCGALSSPVQLLLGVDDITSDKFSVFPNPLLSGSWQLNVNDNLLGSLAEVFDAAGRIVFKSQIKAGHSEINLDVAKGVYLLRITSTDGIFAKKLVKL